MHFEVVGCLLAISLQLSVGSVTYCPQTHPHAYHNGYHCCKYAEERKDLIPLGSCNGAPLKYDSICCRDDQYADCPSSNGCMSFCMDHPSDPTKCYQTIGDVTWTKAKTLCQGLTEYGPARLPVIHDEETLQFLTNNVGGVFWTGLYNDQIPVPNCNNDTCLDTGWYWTSYSDTNTPRTSLSADDLSANNGMFVDDSNLCAVFWTGKLHDSPCEVKFPAVCEVSLDLESRCIAAPAGCCSENLPCFDGEGTCSDNSQCIYGSDGGGCQSGKCPDGKCNTHTQSCYQSSDSCCYEVLNGGWSDYEFGECSATCGGGVKTGTRTCTNPSPQNGGANCKGSPGPLEASCNLDPCEEMDLSTMCQSPASTFDICQKPFNTQCFVQGDYPGNDIKNGLSIEESPIACHFKCRNMPLCMAFAYVIASKECYVKNKMANYVHSPEIISGQKYCEPWMLVFKQDVTTTNPSIQTLFNTDEEVLSFNLEDPTDQNLFSNLDQLVHLKNPLDSEKLHLKLVYKRVTQQDYVFTWKQTSNPAVDALPEGFEDMSSASGSTSPFGGLGVNQGMDSESTYIDGSPTDDSMTWYSIGVKKRLDDHGTGFSGDPTHSENDNMRQGEVTIVELYAMRLFPEPTSFVVTASSSNGMESYLTDCVAKCMPLSTMYFSTDAEAFPWIQIDLTQPRIVLGARLYIRRDTEAPDVTSISNIIVIVTNTQVSSAAPPALSSISSNELCTLYDGPPSSDDEMVEISCTFPIDGQFVVFARNSSESAAFSFNEIQMTLHEIPVAYSSTYEANSAMNHLPKYAIDGLKTTGKFFKSVKELYPWLAIDFGTTRRVEAVTIDLAPTARKKRATSTSSTSLDMSKIEIRVGFEQIKAYATLLNDRNVLCSNTGPTIVGTSVQYACLAPLEGRYVTIQLTEFGVLMLDEVTFTPAPADGGFNSTVEWSACSKTCDFGIQKKDKPCNSPTPFNGGKPCTGNITDQQPCSEYPCPVHGGFGEWSEWTNCSKICGLGVKSRNRTCDDPEPLWGGYPCFGSSEEEMECGDPYEECTKTCHMTCCQDYMLIKENNVMWPVNPAANNPPLDECCTHLSWVGDQQVCGPAVGGGSQVILPTIPLSLGPVDFPSTAIYYWERFDANYTDGGDTGYKVVNGPFQFGKAIRLNKDEEQCLMDDEFALPDDLCIRNPSNCTDGLSFSLFFKPTYDEADHEMVDPTNNYEKEYILSTGGDVGTPGVAIFRQGSKLGALVSTGDETWSMLVEGHIPKRDTWTNIAVRWRPLNFVDATDYKDRADAGESKEDFGGLELFINLNKVGYVMQPEEISCKVVDPATCSSGGVNEALDPVTLSIGCHFTQENDTLRNFASGTWDEIAVWTEWLNDTVKPYFLGGYKAALETMAVEDVMEMIDKVDMSDPEQAIAATSIVNTLVAEEPPASAQTTSSDIEEDPSSSNETITSKPPVEAPVDPTRRIRAMLNVVRALTEPSSLPDIIPPNVLFDIRFAIIEPVGNILSIKGKYRNDYEELHMNNSIQFGAHEAREKLETYLMELLRRRMMTNIDKYEEIKFTKNYAVQFTRLQECIVRARADPNPYSYLSLPNWETNDWTGFRKMMGKKYTPIDEIEVPSKLFNGKCNGQAVMMMTTIHDEFPDPGRKNPTYIKANNLILDSKVITLKMSAIPANHRSPPNWRPNSKDLTCKECQLRLTLGVKSGKNMMIKDGSRKLHFHDESNQKIGKRYCAVWNPDIGTGAWDTDGMTTIYADDTVATCFATKWGTYGIVAEIYEPPSVPEELTWLLVTKFLGYTISIILLLVFVITVLRSKYLWEMFHIISMNLCLAFIGGNFSMILSEIPAVRESRHICAFFGLSTSFFYVAAGMLFATQAYAIFKATTAGIIGGHTRVYLTCSWGMAFFNVGLNIFLNLEGIGNDPRCMVGWENGVKLLFAAFVVAGAVAALLLMVVVILNIQTPAMRKKSLVEEMSSLAQGMFFLVILYAVSWAWYPLSYLRFEGKELPDFYPAFQVLNSWMGLFVFIGVGLGSRRFRTVAAGQVKLRQKQLVSAS